MSSWLHKCQPTMSSGDQQKIPEVVATLGDIQGWSYCKRPCQGVSVLYRRFKQVFKASFSLWSFSLLVDLIYYVLKMQSHHSWVRKERSPPRRENGVYKAEENQSGARTLPGKENVLPRTVLSIKLMNMLQILLISLIHPPNSLFLRPLRIVLPGHHMTFSYESASISSCLWKCLSLSLLFMMVIIF